MSEASITATIVGREAVLARFKERRARIVPAVASRMNREMNRLAAFVRASKLSGQVLKNRTGTLRRSVHGESSVEGNVVSGKVGTNVEYAAAHEYGFHGSVQVHQFMRHNAASLKLARRATRFTNRGRRTGRVLDVVKGNQASEGSELAMSTVRSHVRRMNLPERSFLRSSMNERKDAIMAALNDAVSRVMSLRL